LIKSEVANQLLEPQAPVEEKVALDEKDAMEEIEKIKV